MNRGARILSPDNGNLSKARVSKLTDLKGRSQGDSKSLPKKAYFKY